MGEHIVPIEVGSKSHIGHKRRNWLVSHDRTQQQITMVMRDLQARRSEKPVIGKEKKTTHDLKDKRYMSHEQHQTN